MNENWPEIVETLLPYFGVNSAEGDYQREIEICLKFLGWKKTNETMRSQLTLPIGNNSSIRPDIVLWKKNANGVPTPVLPIEIKRPSNIRNERQENQLMSYMRQLKLNVGLYIGEKIELYYDVPNDGESLVCVFTVEIQKERCQWFHYLRPAHLRYIQFKRRRGILLRTISKDTSTQ